MALVMTSCYNENGRIYMLVYVIYKKSNKMKCENVASWGMMMNSHQINITAAIWYHHANVRMLLWLLNTPVNTLYKWNGKKEDSRY